jgi:hypothetical protein
LQFQLQRRIETYLKTSRTPPARFGRDSVRDPRLVFDIRNGRRLRPATMRRLNAYLDEREKAVER